MFPGEFIHWIKIYTFPWRKGLKIRLTICKNTTKTPNQIRRLVCDGVEFLVCFECLRFQLRLSLSMKVRMICVQPNYHSAVQNFLYFFHFCAFGVGLYLRLIMCMISLTINMGAWVLG